MKRAKMAAVTAVAMSGIVGVGLAVTGTAHAGLNGQQVRICRTNGDYQQVQIEGTNQNGARMTVTNAFGAGCTAIEGYWWVGEIIVTFSQPVATKPELSGLCEVPKEQLTTNFFECRIDTDWPSEMTRTSSSR